MRPGVILAVLLVGQFMAILDVSIVNVAAPTLRNDLHASGAGLQMVIAGYIISYAVLLITGARLGDRFGHGRAFRAGLAGFTVASLACGLAPTTSTLVTFRLVQGAAAALMMPADDEPHPAHVLRRGSGTRALVLLGGDRLRRCVGQVLGGRDGQRRHLRDRMAAGVPRQRADRARCCWRRAAATCPPTGAADRDWTPQASGCSRRRCCCSWSRSCSATRSTGRCGAGCRSPRAPCCSPCSSLVERRLTQRGVARRLVSARVLRAPGLLAGAAALFLGADQLCGLPVHAWRCTCSPVSARARCEAGLVFAPDRDRLRGHRPDLARLPARHHGHIIPIGLVDRGRGLPAARADPARWRRGRRGDGGSTCCSSASRSALRSARC